MKKIILLVSWLLCIYGAGAQVTLKISSGANMVTSGAAKVVMDTGQFVNNGTYMDSTGVFLASGGITFSGAGTSRFNNFIVNNTQHSLVNSLVSVYNTATLTSGNLDANSNLSIRSDQNSIANMVVTGVLTNNVSGIIARASIVTGACPSYSSALSLNISGTAMHYQWQSSVDSTTWSDIVGATTGAYSATVSATSFYRCNLTTTNSAFSESTPGIKLTLTGTIPTVAAISGTTSVIAGSTTTLSDVTTGGVWSSANTAIATVGSGTGIVTGIAAGTALISYTVTNSCGSAAAMMIVTVNPPVSAIAGVTTVCAGSTTTLSDATTGGTWSSSNAAIATVGSAGVVTGVTAGTTLISYTVSGTSVTTIVTVNSSPSPISGSTTLIAGNSATLLDAPAGGVWSSSNTSIATVGSSTGIVSAIAAGTVTISYTLGSGCYTSIIATVYPVGTTFCSSWNNLGAPGFSAGTTGNTSIVIDGAGNKYVVYKDAANGYKITVMENSGSGWYVVGTPAFSTGQIDYPSIALDVTGVPYVVYRDAGNSFKAVVKKFNAGSWVSVGPSTGLSAGTANYTTIAFDGANAPYVAYTDVASSNKVTVMKFNGSSWSSVGGTGFTSGGADNTVVAIDGSNAPYIIYSDNTVSNKATVMKYSSGAWSLIGSAGFSAGEASFPSITIKGTTPYVVYADGFYNTKATVMKFVGSSWVNVGSAGFTGSHADFTWIAVDAANIPYVAFSDYVYGQKASVMKYDGTNWVYAGSPAFSTGYVNCTSIALDAAGIPFVAYSDAGISYAASVSKLDNIAIAPVVGITSVSVGGTTTLTNSTTGGTWSSSNTSVATIGSATGLVTGLSAGTTTISYLLSGGCAATAVVTVSTSVAAITGTLTVCTGSTTTLADATTGGTWSSSNTSVAAIGVTTGVVTGISTGTAIISYTVSGSTVTAIVTVNPLPTAGTITGASAVCISGATTLSNAVSGGSWSSSNTSVATVNSAGLVTGVTFGSAIISYSVTNSCGTDVATKSISTDLTPYAVSITGSPEFCAGSSVAFTSSVTGTSSTGSTSFITTPGTSGGTTVCDCPPGYVAVGYLGQAAAWLDQFSLVCQHLQNGVLSGSTVTTSSNGTSTATAYGPYTFGANTVMVGAQMYVSAPYGSFVGYNAGITGYGQTAANIAAGVNNSSAPSVLTTILGYFTNSPNGSLYVPNGNVITGMYTYDNYYSTGVAFRYKPISAFSSIGGTWSSGSTSVASVDAGGNVSGLSAGVSAISFTIANSCGSVSASQIVTVDALPDAGTITGSSAVCYGSSLTLSNTAGGGSWSSSNTSVATINSSGIVTAVAAGTTTISYTKTGSCGTGVAIKVVTVDLSPSAGTISGTASICLGGSATLSSSVTGGYWSSGNISLATVGTTSGVVTSVAAGNVNITYSVTNSCGAATASRTVTVSASSSAGTITGGTSVGVGNTLALSASVSGGTWSVSNTNATISGTGIITGVAVGSVVVTYTVTNGCGTSMTTKSIDVTYTLSTAIGGSLAVCPGTTTTLSNATSGGVWSSTSTTIATINATSGVVSGLLAGTTTISYTVSGSSVTAIITVNPLPASISGAVNVCLNAVTTLSDATSGGTWSSNDLSIASVDVASGDVTGNNVGTTLLSYTAATGCIETISMTVMPLPTAISGSGSTCVGGTFIVTDATSGGVSWTSSNTAVATIGSGSGLVSGVSSGTSLITYTISTGCAATKLITINAAPSAITGGSVACSGTTLALTDADAGGTWSSSTITVATITSGGILTGVASGVTNITYSLGAGCVTVSPVTVNATPNPVSGTTSICAGSAGALTDATTGGTWSTVDGAVASVDASGIIIGVGSGTTTVSYTASSGCAATATITVNTAVPPITGATSVCAGAATSLSIATSGGTWSSGSVSIATITGGGVVTGVSAGTVAITYTVAAGCRSISILTVNALPATISGAASVCANLSVTFTDATSGGSWSSSNVAFATVDPASGVVTGVSGGSAVISYSSAAGCYKTKTIAVNPAPVAISGTATLCPGGTSTFTDATPTGSAWSTSNSSVATIGSGSGLVTAISTGTATITYTLTTGCIATKVVTVSAPPAAITGSSSICAGTTAAFSDADAGGTWSSSTTAVASIDASGTVTANASGVTNISYSFGGSCVSILNVTINPAPAAITGTTTLCIGSTAGLTDATTGGTWSAVDGAIATVDASGIITGVGPGTTTVSYTASSGCAATATVSVNTAVPPITGSGSVCVGATTPLSVAATGGTWSSGSVAIATITGAGVVTGVSAGTVAITYTVAAGCRSISILTVNALPATISGAASVCADLSVTFTDATSGGSWSSSNVAFATVDPASGVVTGVSGGSAVISYSSAAGCYKTKTIAVNPAPVAISGTAALCPGGTSTFTDATPTGSAWSTSNPAIVTIGSGSGLVTAISTGTATITYTLTTGCIATKVVTVSAPPAAITGSSSICAGTTAAFSDVDAGGTWSSSTTAVASIDASGTVTAHAAGAANITYSLGAGCASVLNVTVNSVPATIGGTTTLCVGSDGTLTDATSGGTWSSGDIAIAAINSAGIATGVSTGTSSITYTSAVGCVTSKIITVNAALSAITGTASLCAGSGTTLTIAASGGTWSSGTTSVATISGAGVVSGISAGTAAISYTITAGCRSIDLVTVNAAPAAITGAASVCVGLSATLSDATSAGTWTTSNSAVATIDPTSGLVSGVAAGIVSVSYTTGGTCYATRNVTITAAPVAISGASSVCTGATSVYTDATSGGVSWSSSTTSVATIGAGSGVLTGVSAGTTTITYLVSSGCVATKVVSVNAAPSPITGIAAACAGTTTTLTDVDAGGTWHSSVAGVASIGSTTGLLTAIATGTSTISYTSVTGCVRTGIMTVNPSPGTITGVTTICVGVTSALACTPAGGTWISSVPAFATISAAGVVTAVSAGATQITYTLATGCYRTTTVTVGSMIDANLGTPITCIGLTTQLSNTTTGGTWSSSSTSIATVNAAGLVSGSAIGTTRITYAVSAGCNSVTVVTVNGSVPVITGTASACIGATSALSIAASGGTWSSSNPSLGSINTSGVVAALVAGTPVISYTFSNGCYRLLSFISKALPVAIAGNLGVCVGGTSIVSDATPVGVSWTSSAPSIATIGSGSGVVTGITAGTAMITYLANSGCIATATFTVDVTPSIAAITGLSAVAIGNTITLADATAGGMWSSSAPAKATIDASGIVTGVATGATTISYTLTNGVCHTSVTKAITVTASRAPSSASQGYSGDIISVYPNPTSGTFTVQTNVAGLFTIYTLEGKELKSTQISEGLNSIELPKGIAAGIYMCRFNGAHETTMMVRLVVE